MTKLIKKPLFPVVFLVGIALIAYYKFFLFGKIPFPGDLLIGSYSPWLDYYKIPVQNPLISDVFSQLILWKYMVIESIKSYQWPLWNPYSFSGTPLLANYQSAVLYPLNLVLFLPKYFGWGIFIFSQTLFSILNFYLFAGLLMRSRIARVSGSIIFAFGGLMTTWLELGTAVAAISWLPLCLFLITKYKQKQKLVYLFLLPFSLLLIILAGFAQITTYSIVIIVLYALIIFADKDLKVFARNTSRVFIPILIALLLAAPQLLPTAELFQKSIRLNDIYTESQNFGLLPLEDSFKFFASDFFGNAVSRNYWGDLNYSETSGFIGTITIPLLLFALIYLKRNRISNFFTILLIGALLLTFNNPLSYALYKSQLPLLTSSYASRMLFICIFAVAVLSALALNQILSEEKQVQRFFKLVIYSLSGLIGTALGILIVFKTIQNIIYSATSAAHFYFVMQDNDYALTNFIVTIRNMVLPVSILIIFIVSYLLINKIKNRYLSIHKNQILALLIILLLCFDLVRYFVKYNPFIKNNLIFPSVAGTQFLQKQPGYFRVAREQAEVLPPNTWAAYHLYSEEGYDPLYLDQYSRYVNLINGGDPRTSGAGRYAQISNYVSPFLDIENVKYFVGVARDDKGRIPGDLINYKFKEANYPTVFKDKSFVVLQNPNALERAYFAPQIMIKPNAQIKDLVMTDKTFDPRKVVALEKDLGVSLVTGSGVVNITSYTNNLIKLTTTTDHDEILILSDQYDSGWKAKVDGKQTVISRANLIFRAIKVPAGFHQIEFYYWPDSFKYGLEISAVALTIWTILFIISRKRSL